MEELNKCQEVLTTTIYQLQFQRVFWVGLALVLFATKLNLYLLTGYFSPSSGWQLTMSITTLKSSL